MKSRKREYTQKSRIVLARSVRAFYCVSFYCMSILSQGAFWTVNKELAKEIGIESALLLSDLLRKEEYFADRGELTEDGFFYNTIEDIEKDTTLSNYQQKKCIDILKKEGYMETDLRGMPAKLHFKIIQSKILSFLNHSFEKTSKQVFKKFETNKNKYNKNKEQDIYSTNVEYNSTSQNLEKVDIEKEEIKPKFVIPKPIHTEIIEEEYDEFAGMLTKEEDPYNPNFIYRDLHAWRIRERQRQAYAEKHAKPEDWIPKTLTYEERILEENKKTLQGDNYRQPMRLKNEFDRQREQELKENQSIVIIKEEKKEDYKKQESSEDLREKVREFLEYRKQIKKPIKEASQKAFQKNLEKLSGGDEKIAIEILDQSIANGWQGIFELKTGNKVKGGLRVV